MYAQALITTMLRSDASNAWMRRIQDELVSNVHEHGRIAQHIDALLSGLYAFPRLSDALYSILKERKSTTGDILTIHSEYFESEKAPPVHLLHHHELFGARVLMMLMCR